MKKEIIGDVPPGTVVRHKGFWGVVTHGRMPGRPFRGIDRWDAPGIVVPLTEVVEVPTKQGRPKE